MDAASKVVKVLQPRQSAGEARSGKNSSNSASGIVSTLIPTFLTFVAFVTLFLLLRAKFHRVYTPRATTSVVRRRNRTKHAKTSLLGWIADFRAIPDEFVLRHNSFDGYLWLRYLKMLIGMCLVGCVITWPILFPINATGPGGQSQLDVLNYSNSAGSPNRYYAHALVSWLFLGFVMVMVARERVYFVGLRQAYYLHPFNAARLSSRTVLFLGVPKDKLNEAALREVFGSAVRKMWFAPDCKKLEKLVEDRDKTANKLEAAEIKVITASLKKQAENKADPEKAGGLSANQDPLQYTEKKDRPTHRLKMIIGKKVDTIDYAYKHLPELSKEIETAREKNLSDEASNATAVFIEFSTQNAAQRAMQTVSLKSRSQLFPRYVGVRPEQVVWKNLGMSNASRKTKNILATTFVVLLTIFWTIPVAIVGLISNVNYLETSVPFLSFISHIPKVILGVVTGLLPVVMLAVLIALVPVIMRLLAKQFEPTLPLVEVKTQSWYFIFQVIQVFLVMTFASGASSVAGQIVKDPSVALTLLAENLPKASNFFINYFILQGLSIAGSTLLSIGSLAMIGVVGKYLDKTPRKQYNRWVNLGGLGWGSVFPKYTNLAVIAISYSCIAPLILGFATVGLFLLYIAFRYNEMFVLGNKVDTKGACYSQALSQLTTGVYLSAVCLAGLFGISKAWGPLGIEVAFIITAAIFHIMMNMILKPLEANLPLGLQSEEDRDMSQVTAIEEGEGVHPNKTEFEQDQIQGGRTGEKMPMTNSMQSNGEQQQYPPLNGSLPSNHWRISNSNVPGHAPRVNGQSGENHDQLDQDRQTTPKDTTQSQAATPKKGFKAKLQHLILPQMVDSGNLPSSPPPKANAITRFLKPHVYATSAALGPLIEDSARPTDSEFPRYGSDDLHDAYINPALTSPMPVIWLAKDHLGLSGMFVRDNESKAGLESSDAGAEFTAKNKALWIPPEPLEEGNKEHDRMGEEEAEGRWMEKVPIWRREADY